MIDIAGILFYLFSALLIGSAWVVISSRNPVSSVLSLIFAFFNAAALFVLIGAEYIAMTLVIVYVGAVAILFLFVVMMLDIKMTELRQGFARYIPFGMVMATGLFALVYLMITGGIMRAPEKGDAKLPIPEPSIRDNAEAIGDVLYTDFVLPFQVAGLVLLVAMVGAIVLTLRHKQDVRRQNVMNQLARGKKDGVELVDVPTRSGV